jgi:hypothetical protein
VVGGNGAVIAIINVGEAAQIRQAADALELPRR